MLLFLLGLVRLRSLDISSCRTDSEPVLVCSADKVIGDCHSCVREFTLSWCAQDAVSFSVFMRRMAPAKQVICTQYRKHGESACAGGIFALFGFTENFGPKPAVYTLDCQTLSVLKEFIKAGKALLPQVGRRGSWIEDDRGRSANRLARTKPRNCQLSD